MIRPRKIEVRLKYLTAAVELCGVRYMRQILNKKPSLIFVRNTGQKPGFSEKLGFSFFHSSFPSSLPFHPDSALGVRTNHPARHDGAIKFLPGQQLQFEDHLPQCLAFLMSFFGNSRRVVIADVGIERSNKH